MGPCAASPLLGLDGEPQEEREHRPDPAGRVLAWAQICRTHFLRHFESGLGSRVAS